MRPQVRELHNLFRTTATATTTCNRDHHHHNLNTNAPTAPTVLTMQFAALLVANRIDSHVVGGSLRDCAYL